MNKKTIIAFAFFIIIAQPSFTLAEPYLAVKTGYQCSACHVNPTGGGKRTELGNIYGQTTLVRDKQSDNTSKKPPLFRGNNPSEYIALGGNLRANLNQTSIPNEKDDLSFDLQSAQLYAEIKLIPNRFSVYIDEQIAPGGALNREAYGLWWDKNHQFYIKAGKFFLPYGLRLEDDSAFNRAITGINFDSSDNGIEAGLIKGPWAASLALSNGTSGGKETDTSKQISLLTNYTQSTWRGGFSVNINDTEDNSGRRMGNIFAGLRTGPIAWLAQYDHIRDEQATDSITQNIGFLEANWGYKKGHNLKMTYEHLDPNTDIDEDERERYSLAWESTPMRFLQMRLGYRKNEGIPQNNRQNSEEIFLQNHLYF